MPRTFLSPLFSRSRLATSSILAVALLLAALCGSALGQTDSGGAAPPPAKADKPAAKADDRSEFTQSEIEREVSGFFDKTTTGLAEVVEKAFKDYGRPNGYIKGAEGGGAFFVGLRYGDGELTMKRGIRRKVYWQGPSFGLDWGGNLSKAFILVYRLRDPRDIFQRFPGVEGSAYLVGGASLNYQRSGDIVLAPIRTGVGLRLGANVGYMHFTPELRLNPF